MSTNIVLLGHIERGDVDDQNEENGLNICENCDIYPETTTTSSTGSQTSNDFVEMVTKNNDESPDSPTDVTIKDKVYTIERKFASDNNSDSGVDLTDATLQTSDSELSPSKIIKSSHSAYSLTNNQSNVVLGNESNSSSPLSVSPDNNVFTDGPSPVSSPVNDNSISVPKETKEVTIETDCTNNLLNLHSDNYALLKPINSSLTTSSISLNEQNVSHNLINKSPYSKSAENIQTLSQNNDESNITLSNNDLNTEAILTEFSNQKTKVTAVHKIPETQMNLDMRYPRIPKEILSQDIGSIVKNVHGIFSSMSGSFKNAYTHRTSVQKPVKPVTNGKIMSDIFEDETIEVEGEKTKTAESILDSNMDVLKKGKEAECQENTKQDVLRIQVETLERLLADQRRENTSLRERVKQHVDEAQEKDQIYKELEVKLDMVSEA